MERIRDSFDRQMPLKTQLKQARQTAFVSLAGAYQVTASMAYRGNASTGSALLVSGNYFETLAVGAAIGRVFDAGDDRVPGGHPLVVLSHARWVSRFGADPGVLNRTLIVNGRGMTVVGVAQKGFGGETPGSTSDIFVPIAIELKRASVLRGYRGDQRL